MPLRNNNNASAKNENIVSSSSNSVAYRCVLLQNIDFGVSVDEIRDFFSGCGPIYKIRILYVKSKTGPFVSVSVEFRCPRSVPMAIAMNAGTIRGKPITVVPKAENHPYLLAVEPEACVGESIEPMLQFGFGDQIAARFGNLKIKAKRIMQKFKK